MVVVVDTPIKPKIQIVSINITFKYKKVETYSERCTKIDLLKRRKCQLSRIEGRGTMGWKHLVKDETSEQ
jgi:hypothetical protein